MGKSVIDTIRQTTKSKSFLVMTVLMAGIIAGLFYYQPGVGYEIVSNGEHVGYARTKLEAESAVNNMKNRILEEKGEGATFDTEITYVKGKMGENTFTSAEVMKYNFENSIDVKVPAYLIKKDSEFVMAVKDEETAKQVLEVAKSPYKKETNDIISNVKVDFVQDVKIVKLEHVSETKILPQNEALATVNPSTSVSRSNAVRTTTATPAKKVNIFDVKTTYQEFSTKPVEPGVKKVPNSDLYVGETKLLSEGQPGVREIYTQVTLVNGNKVEAKTLSQKVAKKAVDKVVYYGTKTRPVVNSTRGRSTRGGGSVVVSGNASGVAGIAMKYLGTPYVYGGTSPRGFDCSGFTQYVYRQAGVNLPRTSGAQSRAGQYVSLSNIKSGDLLYGPGHVGIYIGNGQYIHSPVPGQSVRIQPISTFPGLSHGVRVIG
ncbi:MAG: NlpC/P60 family protein [Peptostreptococcaceae bacterium]|nr:NlpC/P60 family protein [Peptostreptococcaceae bacterium]